MVIDPESTGIDVDVEEHLDLEKAKKVFLQDPGRKFTLEELQNKGISEDTCKKLASRGIRWIRIHDARYSLMTTPATILEYIKNYLPNVEVSGKILMDTGFSHRAYMHLRDLSQSGPLILNIVEYREKKYSLPVSLKVKVAGLNGGPLLINLTCWGMKLPVKPEQADDNIVIKIRIPFNWNICFLLGCQDGKEIVVNTYLLEQQIPGETVITNNNMLLELLVPKNRFEATVDGNEVSLEKRTTETYQVTEEYVQKIGEERISFKIDQEKLALVIELSSTKENSHFSAGIGITDGGGIRSITGVKKIEISSVIHR